MPELLISKFVDKPFEENISFFKSTLMQIGFFNPHVFFNYNHKDLVQKINDNDIKIKSIHAPTIDIFQEHDFFGMLDKIKEEYPKIDNITIHPGSGNPLKAFKFFERFEDKIDSYEISFLYENFDSSKKNKRWLPRARNIYSVPIKNIFLTYDTSHVKIGTDIVSDLKEFYPRLGMIHLSNKSRRVNHLPIYEGEHDLSKVVNYLQNYPGFVTLEYHNRDDTLMQDYSDLLTLFKNRGVNNSN